MRLVAKRLCAGFPALPSGSFQARSETAQLKKQGSHTVVLPASDSDQCQSCFSSGLPLHREFVLLEVCETAAVQAVPLMFPVLQVVENYRGLPSYGDSSLCFSAPSRQRSSLVRSPPYPPCTPG